MNATPVLSVVSKEVADPLYREAPHNVEAEQAILGSILINNDALNHVGDFLQADHFYEPVHQRLFEAIRKFHDKGLIASPVTLKHYFDQDTALTEVGGGAYLAKLASAAVTVMNINHLGHLVHDLALKRSLITVGEEMVNTAYAQNVDVDATQQIETAEQKLFNLASEGDGESGFRPLRHSLTDAIHRTENAYKNSGRVVGVSTGLSDLDKLLGGLQRSDLVILAGRPSMGKTALATNIAFNASKFFADEVADDPLSKEQKSVGFFSLEMSAEQLATRLLSSATNINSSKLLRGDINNDDFGNLVRTSNDLARLKFHIDDTPALSISALRTRARRLKRTQNLGLLVVDYLQLVRAHATVSHNNRVLEVSEITQGLKAIAKELSIPVLALSQLSRAVEQRTDKKPQLADLRESGSIEQDADVVMFVYREEYYLSREEPREGTPEHAVWQEKMEKVHGLAEVLIGKQRNGPIGNVTLQFDSSLTRFSTYARPDFLPEQRG